LSLALLCSAPLVVSALATWLGAPVWLVAILLLPAYAGMLDLIQP
jgi:hypothetical protein